MKQLMIVTLILLLLCNVNLYSQESGIHQPIGKLVDAGGHLLHVNIKGKGGPTVVMENGSHDFSFIWSLVQPEVSKFAQTVSYDRAGYAWSEPGPLPRTSHQMAYELHTALQNAGVKGPYVLVGQSVGGFRVRAFARYYPKEAVGMVLVDVLNEDSKVIIGGKGMRIREFAKGQQAPAIRTTFKNDKKESQDLDKLTTTIDPPLDKLPPDIQKLQIWAQSQEKFSKAAQSEMDWSPEDVADLYDNRGKNEYMLGGIPLIVISRGDGGYEGLPDGVELEKERLKLQEELTHLSTNSKHIIDKKSGHNIHVEDPETVIDAIKLVVDAVKNKAKLN
jgi:pimeloyl-ACP methyl ester carboxylesterase